MALGELMSIEALPGIFKERSSYDSPARFTDGSNVRFHKGRPRKIGGSATLKASALDGPARDVVAWKTLANTNVMAMSTLQRVWLTNDDGVTFHNITPATTVTIASGNISATDGDPTITITHSTHGLTTGEWVVFDDTISWAGITISAGDDYQVTVVNGNTYTIEHTQTPTSTAAYTGGGTDILYEISWLTNGVREGPWYMVPFGEDLIACFWGGALYFWDAGTVAAPSRMTAVSGFPASTGSILPIVTSDRHLVSLGRIAPSGAGHDTTNIFWADQETTGTWTSSASNTAGDHDLESGTEIVGAIKIGDFGHLVLTDVSAHLLRPIGRPFVMSITTVDVASGIIGARAGIAFGSIAYWWGREKFHLFDGVVRDFPCDVQDYVFGRLDWDNAGKVWAGTTAKYNEIVWLYPSTDGNGHNDSIVGVNLGEDSGPAWWLGDIERSVWMDTSLFSQQFPISADNDGNVLYQENTVNDSGSALEYDITWPEIELPDGNAFIRGVQLVPDFKTIAGSHALTITLRDRPQGATRSKGPYTITSATKKVSFRARGRTIQLKLAGTATGTDFELGRWRLMVQGGVGKRQ